MELKKKNLVFLALVFVAVIAYVIWSSGWDNIVMLVQQADWPWALAAVAMIVAYWLLEAGILHSVVLCYEKNHKFKATFATTMIGQLFNCVTPFSSGGQPVQAYHMTKTGLSLGTGVGALLVRFILYQIALTIYSAAVLIWKWSYFSTQVSGFGYLVFIGFAINTAVMLFLLSICFFRNFTRGIAVFFIKLGAKIRLVKDKDATIAYLDGELKSFHEGFAVLKKHIGMMCYTMIMSLLQLTAFFMIPYFLFLTFDVFTIPADVVISAQAFVTMISSFVPLPGASGGAEYSFITFFSPFCSEQSIINLIMLLWRMITFYLPIIVGMVFFVKEMKWIKKSDPEEETSE